MSKNNLITLLTNAIMNYIIDNSLSTTFETAYVFNSESCYFGVFDLPSEINAFENGGINESPECKMKIILVAKLLSDGNIIVEETDLTSRYLQKVVQIA